MFSSLDTGSKAEELSGEYFCVNVKKVCKYGSLKLIGNGSVTYC